MNFWKKKIPKEITMVPRGVHLTPSEFDTRYPTRPNPTHAPQRAT